MCGSCSQGRSENISGWGAIQGQVPATRTSPAAQFLHFKDTESLGGGRHVTAQTLQGGALGAILGTKILLTVRTNLELAPGQRDCRRVLCTDTSVTPGAPPGAKLGAALAPRGEAPEQSRQLNDEGFIPKIIQHKQEHHESQPG